MAQTRRWGKLALGLLWLALSLARGAVARDLQAAPEPAGMRATPPGAVIARPAMVVAAHPLAAEAGAMVLSSGGSAADAAIAMQLMLAVVEPQSSGLGGGAFALHWDPVARQIVTLDAREIAPAAIRPDQFLDAAGKPLPFRRAQRSPHAVGIPGVPALLEELGRRWGRLPRDQVAAPAIDRAAHGFQVSHRLSAVLAELTAEGGTTDPIATSLYLRQGQPLAAGTWLRQPELAATLRLFAAEGATPFYRGPVSAAIRARLATEGLSVGAEEFAAYRVVERPPVCFPFRHYQVCGMGPPSSGGLAVGQALSIMGDVPDGQALLALDRLARASRLAFADRDSWISDPDHAAVPTAGLADPAYLARRAALLWAPLADKQPAGQPPGSAASPGAGSGQEVPGTSHLVAVDHCGAIISMTTTIEAAFGSQRIAAGLWLNNQLTDFSFTSADPVTGRPVANAAAPGKRPRSSMAPTLVLDAAGQPVLAIGSPGGSRIIGYVAAALVRILALGMNPQEAVSAPHVLNRNGPTEVEAGPAGDALAAALRDLGHEVTRAEMTSGIHAIQLLPGAVLGAADPRREGVALSIGPGPCRRP